MKHSLLLIGALFLYIGCSPSEPLELPNTETVTMQEEAADIATEDTTLTPEVVEDAPPYPVSLEALQQQSLTGDQFTLEEVLARTNAYTRYRISYVADGLRLSGIMNIPVGDGPFPLVVLNHGYIDPAVYTNGRGLKREQDFIARRGYAVVHPDYRNHAFGDKDPDTTTNFRLGYTIDVIGAIKAIQTSTLPELVSVDASRVGMLGHSMGGGVTQNVLVVEPELVQAAVLYAPVSSDARGSLEQYFLRDGARSDRVRAIFETHGSPEENPSFWDGISPKTYVERIQSPVQVYIGTRDESTPPQWSYDIAQQLEDANKKVELIIYEGERHEFGPRWQDFMEGTVQFFDTTL